MRLGLALAAASTAFLAAVAAAPPPGATARCADGSFSFSTHHSGTCSHHGGVAAWLDGGGRAPAPSGVAAGATVLFGVQTKSAHCVLGPVPDRACSPGAYSTGLTKAVVCGAGFHTSSVRNVSQATKYAVERAYGLAPRPYGRTLEIDHIVPLELGGSNAIANLFPERDYRRKDALENRVHALVCAGRMDLRAAQRAIATDWRALYSRLYG